METVSFVVRLESSAGLNLTMWRWYYWFILWPPTGTTPPSASKMITSMEVAAAAAAAAAEVAAEVERWRVEGGGSGDGGGKTHKMRMSSCVSYKILVWVVSTQKSSVGDIIFVLVG